MEERDLLSSTDLVGLSRVFYPGLLSRRPFRSLFQCLLDYVSGKLITPRPVKHSCDVGCLMSHINGAGAEAAAGAESRAEAGGVTAWLSANRTRQAAFILLLLLISL